MIVSICHFDVQIFDKFIDSLDILFKFWLIAFIVTKVNWELIDFF